MEPLGKGEMTPLHFAAGAGSAAQVASLLESGWDANALLEQGWTPLHFAAAWGRVTVVALLLANGANPKARANDGSTPMDLAVRHQKETVRRVLDRHEGRLGRLPPKPAAH